MTTTLLKNQFLTLVFIALVGLLVFSACSETDTKATTEAIADKNPLITIMEVDKRKNIEQDDQEEQGLIKKEKRGFDFLYQLNAPDQTFNLPAALIEVSGLSYDVKRNHLLVVNDEHGVLYELSAEDGSKLEHHSFAMLGDFEGLELVGDEVYIVKSNGNIHSFNISTKEAGKVLKNDLSSVNDVEGLGYDPKADELILACKGAPELKGRSKMKKAKAFYRYNVAKEKLYKKPKFVIKDKDLEDFFKKAWKKEGSKKSRKKLARRIENFSPSGIAKHPVDGNFYILSSVGKSLVVVDEEGELQAIQFLDDKKFAQPEGICFTPDGTMFVSNEGRSLVAKILKFNYLPANPQE